MDTIYQEACKGCLTLMICKDQNNSSICNVANNDKSEICPCLNCLVKGVCRTTCSKYDLIYLDIMNRKNKR